MDGLRVRNGEMVRMRKRVKGGEKEGMGGVKGGKELRVGKGGKVMDGEKWAGFRVGKR